MILNFKLYTENTQEFYKQISNGLSYREMNLTMVSMSSSNILKLKAFCEKNGIVDYNSKEHKNWFVNIFNLRTEELKKEKEVISRYINDEDDSDIWISDRSKEIVDPIALYSIPSSSDNSDDQQQYDGEIIKSFKISKYVSDRYFPKDEINIEVYQCDEDWFIVNYEKNGKLCYKYKCDQIDGTILLLEKLIINVKL